MKKTIFTLLMSLSIVSSIANAEVKEIQYSGFTIWLDCDKRGPAMFQYDTSKDIGNLPRKTSFTVDPNIPKRCQQTSTKPYGHGYDRGHLVPANHFDYSKLTLTEVNYMTNILPQTSTMNRGAWYLTEEIIECYRDLGPITVIGGTIWRVKQNNDIFLKSHNVATPEKFWKVVVLHANGKDTVISWVVPNDNTATRVNLDKFLVSVRGIEKLTHQNINIPEKYKDHTVDRSWSLPAQCKLS